MPSVGERDCAIDLLRHLVLDTCEFVHADPVSEEHERIPELPALDLGLVAVAI